MTTLLNNIRQSVIGDRISIKTAFGTKPLIYADYTASGRSLGLIEDFIRDQVLPFYANTHTETSYTGAQTTAFREEARLEIAKAINANDEYAIIFCGSGTTAAIDKLIAIMNLRLPDELNERYRLLEQIPTEQRPVVLIGPYEHHSNELPWRESIAELVSIPLCEKGLLDHRVLEQKLVEYKDRPIKIGSFSAASNVTGIKTQVKEITQLLNRFGALSFWDYAAAAPYVEIDMQGENSDSSKDAVFISPHKFIGGPGTPGILAIRRSLLENRVPAVAGGGTVVYVTPEDHQYIDNAERREEGGTPAIIESIRAGLVFKLQQKVGTDTIGQLEEAFVSAAIQRWSGHPNIEILGNTDAERLSITSFKIKYGKKDLHYNFVVALLNDLFGVQARGGCSCAGPYGHSLLKMDMGTSKAIEKQLLDGQMVLRPGWVRINFNYFIDQESFDYIVDAVEIIADHGWRLLPLYNFDATNGTWRYQNAEIPRMASLNDINFTSKENTPATSITDNNPLADHLANGKRQILEQIGKLKKYSIDLPKEAKDLCWFLLPQDIESQTTQRGRSKGLIEF